MVVHNPSTRAARRHREDLGTSLQSLLDETVEGDPAVEGGVLHVGSPGFKWEFAAGLCDPQRSVTMLPGDQFQAASITKMVTATTVMALVEEGQIDLDVGIGCYLPPFVTSRLHEFNDRSHGLEITPRQLLSHTSGVADFFGDGVPDSDGSLPFLTRMREEPDRLWDPLDLIEWTKQNLQSHFPPGNGWHYSDTGYVLLGLIIEAVTGNRLHDVMRAKVFEPLGMAYTYMLFREPDRPSLPGRRPSIAYSGAGEYGATRSVSADWGGGGLVSTANDLARFIRAFADDLVFRNRSSRRQMLTWSQTGEPGVYYGLGVRRFVLDELGVPGLGEAWGHTGFLKSFMLYWPQHDITICGTLNQAAAKGEFSVLRPVSALVPAVLTAIS